MTDPQRIFGTSEDNPYENKDKFVSKIFQAEMFFGSLVMEIVILCIAVYLCKIKQW